MSDPALQAFARHARLMATAKPGAKVTAVWPDSRGREEERPLPDLTDEERDTWRRLAAEAEARR
jgi:hypothetical protein